MKSIIRSYVMYTIALLAITFVFKDSFVVNGDVQVYLFAAGVLTLLNLLVKPVLNLLFLPIHALTLGLFSIVVNIGVFYLFLRIVPQISISAWQFPGFTFNALTLPPLLFQPIGTLIAASFLVTLITNFFGYLIE